MKKYICSCLTFIMIFMNLIPVYATTDNDLTSTEPTAQQYTIKKIDQEGIL